MKRLVALLCAGAFGLAGGGPARASCGAAFCPLDAHKHSPAKQLQLSLSHEYINQNQINVGSKKSFVGALPNAHDEIETKNQRTLFTAQYGITPSLGAMAEIPFITRDHRHLEDGALETFHFEGFGDLSVNGRYALALSDTEEAPRLTLLAGVKIPTGVTGVRDDEGLEKAEVTIQPGTGSWDGLFGLNLQLPLFALRSLSGGLSGRLPLHASVNYRVNGRGTDGYRFGNQVMAHLGTEYQIFPRFSLLFQANGRWQDFAKVGTTGEFRSNTGGTWIFLSPGASFQFNHAFSAYGYAQVPVYQKVNGIQQVAKLNLQVGLSANVTLLK